jgi:hypothetical protein
LLLIRSAIYICLGPEGAGGAEGAQVAAEAEAGVVAGDQGAAAVVAVGEAHAATVAAAGVTVAAAPTRAAGEGILRVGVTYIALFSLPPGLMLNEILDYVES